MSSDSATYGARLRAPRLRGRSMSAIVGRLRSRPELTVLLSVAALMNLWGLSVNGWANAYYSAAVRSMASSWHDFLFASLDKAGLMTVDKPPLSLWVQALSVRVFGFHPLSILVPEALMGVAAAGLVYDLTRRRFGRPAGFAAGFVLATTPITVAISRHNNPDQLLILCCVAALWFLVRALETGATRWLIWSGVCVGLGFETKMGVALMVVPGIASAYLWVAPRGRLRALRQLGAGAVAMAVVGLAWPVLVMLTPAADRPWISGTSDNSIWSLILSYNGVGRIAGQAGGPAAFGGGGPGAGGGGGGGLFGGSSGVLRLLQSGLGDQAGWLLGFAVVVGVALVVVSRLRRSDPRTGWLLAIGGSFATTAIVFSFAQGIFHPYYVSFLAPFTAALVGAGVGQMLSSRRSARVLAPLALVAAIVTELAVLGTLGGALSWAKPIVVGIAGGCAIGLALFVAPRIRAVLVSVALAALLAAPATWAAETIGHATSGTFPSGGPASASSGVGGGGLGPGAGAGFRSGPPRGSAGHFGGGGFGGGGLGGPPAGGFGGPTGRAFSGGPSRAGGGGGFGGDSATLSAEIAYAKAHGGGTIGVASQSSAAAAILSSNADVAGLGGFSGRESSVTAKWIAMEVNDGRLRWVVAEGGQSLGGPGDTRTGSAAAVRIVAETCPAVKVRTTTQTVKMYDCRGRAQAILAAAQRAAAQRR